MALHDMDECAHESERREQSQSWSLKTLQKVSHDTSEFEFSSLLCDTLCFSGIILSLFCSFPFWFIAHVAGGRLPG